MNFAALTRESFVRPHFKEAKYECLRALRAPGFALPTLFLPAVFYLFFGLVLAEETTLEIDRFLFVGFAILGVMGTGLFGFGVFVATEREQGLLALKRALPMPAAAYLLGKMLMTTAFAAGVTLVVVAAALAAGRVPLTPVQILTLTAVNVLGSLPFCALGLFVGTLAGARSAPVLVNLLFLPMIYLSGILIPLPEEFASIRLPSPAYHLSRLALSVAGASIDSAPLVHAAVIAGVTLLFGALALRRLAQRG
jgi:ABC-2 type transport system permease protein